MLESPAGGRRHLEPSEQQLRHPLPHQFEGLMDRCEKRHLGEKSVLSDWDFCRFLLSALELLLGYSQVHLPQMRKVDFHDVLPVSCSLSRGERVCTRIMRAYMRGGGGGEGPCAVSQKIRSLPALSPGSPPQIVHPPSGNPPEEACDLFCSLSSPGLLVGPEPAPGAERVRDPNPARRRPPPLVAILGRAGLSQNPNGSRGCPFRPAAPPGARRLPKWVPASSAAPAHWVR